MKKELELEAMSTWLPTNGLPAVISGPCSAETESQTIATAKQLAATGKVNALACRYLETQNAARTI
jgi:chorismate mutase